jgi:hypothetical protein
MSASTATMVPKKGRPRVHISRADMEAHFDMPQPMAATKLGVSLSALKNACRKYEVARWPYRRRWFQDRTDRLRASPPESQESRPASPSETGISEGGRHATDEPEARVSRLMGLEGSSSRARFAEYESSASTSGAVQTAGGARRRRDKDRASDQPALPLAAAMHVAISLPDKSSNTNSGGSDNDDFTTFTTAAPPICPTGGVFGKKTFTTEAVGMCGGTCSGTSTSTGGGTGSSEDGCGSEDGSSNAQRTQRDGSADGSDCCSNTDSKDGKAPAGSVSTDRTDASRDSKSSSRRCSSRRSQSTSRSPEAGSTDAAKQPSSSSAGVRCENANASPDHWQDWMQNQQQHSSSSSSSSSQRLPRKRASGSPDSDGSSEGSGSGASDDSDFDKVLRSIGRGDSKLAVEQQARDATACLDMWI